MMKAVMNASYMDVFIGFEKDGVQRRGAGLREMSPCGSTPASNAMNRVDRQGKIPLYQPRAPDGR